MSCIIKCSCLESYFSKADVRNSIITKPYVWSAIIAIISSLHAVWKYSIPNLSLSISIRIWDAMSWSLTAWSTTAPDPSTNMQPQRAEGGRGKPRDDERPQRVGELPAAWRSCSQQAPHPQRAWIRRAAGVHRASVSADPGPKCSGLPASLRPAVLQGQTWRQVSSTKASLNSD